MCSCYGVNKGEYHEHSGDRPSYVRTSDLELMVSLYKTSNNYQQASY